MTIFKKILELTKRLREWDDANILKNDDYGYSNERARQLTEEYCHETAVDVFHYLFHKTDDEESLEYREGRRDYAQIELQLTGGIDSSISLHDPNNDVDYRRGSIKAHITCNPYFRGVRVWDQWQNMSKDAYDVKKKSAWISFVIHPHVLRIESWALLLVMTILSKDELSNVLVFVSVRTGMTTVLQKC
jgi:extradiol dioxygenase family protein